MNLNEDNNALLVHSLTVERQFTGLFIESLTVFETELNYFQKKRTFLYGGRSCVSIGVMATISIDSINQCGGFSGLFFVIQSCDMQTYNIRIDVKCFCVTKQMDYHHDEAFSGAILSTQLIFGDKGFLFRSINFSFLKNITYTPKVEEEKLLQTL